MFNLFVFASIYQSSLMLYMLIECVNKFKAVDIKQMWHGENLMQIH
jgi:hypothetical protein